MLKLRNAVLTALLAFCLAMPFVSCSFNDGATGDVSNLVCDVSNLVTEQTGNNQNGGNGGSTGGNENPSGGNEKPGEGTTYVVKYNGDIIEKSLSESMWSYGVEERNLIEGVDYTIDGTVITLTDSGYEKVLPLLGDSGDDGEHGVIPPVTNGPVTDGPVPDVPGDVEGTMYTVKYGDTVIVPAMPESALSSFETACGLKEGTDYTISGTVITLKDSGFEKVKAAGFGAGE